MACEAAAGVGCDEGHGVVVWGHGTFEVTSGVPVGRGGGRRGGGWGGLRMVVVVVVVVALWGTHWQGVSWETGAEVA
jgi:hypothetical protein